MPKGAVVRHLVLGGTGTVGHRLMYDMFQKKGLKATPAQLQETRTILGHEPRTYADFVRETVASWR
jgi:hypothetical protein